MFIRRKSFFVALLLMVGLASIVKADDQIYVEGYNDNFGLLDPQTGAYTLIGVTSERIGGIGFGSDGSLYGLGNNAILYRVNTSTGNLTEIGNTGLTLNPAYGMGATQDGTLYAFGHKNQMYTINSINAQATFLGNTGFDSDCDPVGEAAGNLYNSQGVYGSGFYKIDRMTGAGTQLGNSTTSGLYALAYTNDTMYGINPTGSIYTVSPTNGATMLLSTYNINAVGGPNGAYGATARISSVPEASTLMICSLAGVLSGACWLRHRRLA